MFQVTFVDCLNWNYFFTAPVLIVTIISGLNVQWAIQSNTIFDKILR